MLTKSDVLAALSVPVELEGGPIGTLNLYSAKPRELEHRSLIERAKGILMAKHDIDAATAFERLRGAARSSRRPLVEVVREVIDGKPPPGRRNNGR